MIEKLEFEMKKARDDSEKSTEARIGRLKAKHETEIGNHIFFVPLLGSCHGPRCLCSFYS